MGGFVTRYRFYWEVPSYERALPHLLQLDDADVITFECASNDGKDLPLFAKYQTDKKIGIGVVNHYTVVEPAEHVAGLIRKALEYIPPERLVITTDCGFGREGLSYPNRPCPPRKCRPVLSRNLV
jgi:5-methyltetrahydropteroyltriglutamate--homocysteine methyltransferase